MSLACSLQANVPEEEQNENTPGKVEGAPGPPSTNHPNKSKRIHCRGVKAAPTSQINDMIVHGVMSIFRISDFPPFPPCLRGEISPKFLLTE